MTRLGTSEGQPLPADTADTIMRLIESEYALAEVGEVGGVPVYAVFEDFETGEYFRITLQTAFYDEEDDET